jgi:hypothetical protein
VIANRSILEMMERRDDVVIECETCPAQIRIPLPDWQESADPRADAGWRQVRNMAKQWEDYCPDCSDLYGFNPVIDDVLLWGKPANVKRDRDNPYRLNTKGEHS